MKIKTAMKYSLIYCSMLAVIWLSGCGKRTIESAETQMAEDFYYIIEDVFALQDRNDVVVVGCNRNSKMYTDTEVDILSVDGRIQTQILDMEDATGKVDCVEEDSNVGVMLSGVTSDRIKPGDIIVLRDQGMVGNEINAMISLTSVGEEQTFVELTEGQTVDVIFYDEKIETTILSKELIEETPDGDVLYLKLELEKPVAYVDNQILYLEEQDGNMIGVGLVVIE